MYHYALTFVSKDRPGIVATVTKVLFEKGFNIADSSSTLLQGVFSMILLVEHPENISEEEIKMYFMVHELIPAVHQIPKEEMGKDDAEHFVLSVYGADKPGIVHSIAQELARLNINIIDLQTQIAGIPPKEAYIMILEVVVPDEIDPAWVQDVKDTAKEIGTDITVRHLDVFEL